MHLLAPVLPRAALDAAMATSATTAAAAAPTSFFACLVFCFENVSSFAGRPSAGNHVHSKCITEVLLHQTFICLSRSASPAFSDLRRPSRSLTTS